MAFLRFRSVHCIPEDDINDHKRIIFSSVCITTATLSSYGAFVQLRSWHRHLKDFESRRKPSSNPVITFCLALADLFTCIGVILMSILFITFSPPYSKSDKYIPHEDWYQYISVPIESFTMFAYISSYMWTLAYAMDICLQVYNKDKRLKIRWYLIFFWVAPVWLVAVGQFAYLYDSEGFCSIRDQEVVHFMVCFIPLVCVVLLLPIIYVKVILKLRKNIMGAHGCYTNAERELLFAVKKKFLRIVAVFIICWITNVVDGFIDFSIVLGQPHDQYVQENGSSHFENHFAIWIIEAIVNPLQGFLNCLVYGQAREMTDCCRRCCQPSPYTTLTWPEARSDQSESFLINSQETLERSPLLRQSDNQSRQTAHCEGKTSPFFEAKQTFTPRLLGEPRIT